MHNDVEKEMLQLVLVSIASLFKTTSKGWPNPTCQLTS